MNILNILKEKDFDNFIIFLVFLLGLKTLFLEENYITYDELYSLINYTNVFTLFLKDNLNNHVINSFVGIIISKLTYEIIFFRLFSYLAFIGSLIFLLKSQRSNNIIFIFLIFLLLGNNFFVYSFLYRGYPYYLLLFAITFYFLTNSNGQKFSNIILILFSILTFLAPSNILLIFPLIFFYREKFKFKNIFFLYLCLTSFLLLPHIILNGIYELRGVIEIYNLNEFFFNANIFLDIIYNGLISYYDLIFGFYQDRDTFDHIKIFLRDDKLILSLYIIFFINIIIRIIRRLRLTIYDKIFISKFILILILSNAPVARVYYPFYIFYILYLDQILSKIKFNSYIKGPVPKFFKVVVVILLLFNFSLENHINKNFDISIHYKNIKTKYINLDPKKNNCNLDTNLKEPLLKDIYYYKYLIECNRKINIFEIKKFQKL